MNTLNNTAKHLSHRRRVMESSFDENFYNQSYQKDLECFFFTCCKIIFNVLPDEVHRTNIDTVPHLV